MTVDTFIDRIESDGLVVLTNNGEDIPLGTKFTELAKVLLSTSGLQPVLLSDDHVADVELILKEVHIFRESVAILPKGYSAGCKLEGSGMAAIREALRIKGIAEYVHLRAAPV